MPRQIIRPPGPEELDQLVRVSVPFAWVAFLFLAASILGVTFWSTQATAPVKISAKGIILQNQGVLDVVSTVEGQVETVLVEVGQPISQGMVVAELIQPGLNDELAAATANVDRLQRRLNRVLDFQATARAENRMVSTDTIAAETSRLSDLEARLERADTTLAGIERLIERGLTTRTRLNQASNEREQIAAEIGRSRTRLSELRSTETQARLNRQREQLDLELQIENAQAELDLLTQQVGRTRVIKSGVEGIVSEVLIRRGDLLSPGRVGIRVVSQLDKQRNEQLYALIYASAQDGKKLRPGMSVELVPATARRERDSFMLGEVSRVAELPSTVENIQATLRNTRLVDELTLGGAPYQIEVRLKTDETTRSGFAWSNGRGLNGEVENGTLLEAQAVADRIPIIALFIPQAETALEWIWAQ